MSKVKSEEAVSYEVTTSTGGIHIQTGNELVEQALSILYSRIKTQDCFTSVQDTKDYLYLKLKEKTEEQFCCIWLNNRHRLIEFEVCFKGTVDSCSVYPREIVRSAIRTNGAAVIFAHNHPSGCAEPSTADERITKRLKEALALIDVRVLDHFVVGDEIVSFAERGLL